MRISELAAVVSERLLSELASEMAGKKTSAGDVTGLREWTGRTTEALAKVLAAIRTLREWHLSDPNLLQMVGTKALEADALVERAANDLYTIAAELKFAKLPMHDIPTALSVLQTGSYPLPEIITKTLSKEQALSETDIEDTLSALSDATRLRLASKEYIPAGMRSGIKIDNGKVVLTVAKSFEITLVLGGVVDQGSISEASWRLTNIRGLVAFASCGYEGWSSPLTDTFTLQTLSEGVQSRLSDPMTEAPLLSVFEYLHSFSTRLQLEMLTAQAQFLNGTRWTGTLSVEALQGDSKYSGIRVFYWGSTNTDRKSQTAAGLTVTRKFVEFRVETVDTSPTSHADLSLVQCPAGRKDVLKYVKTVRGCMRNVKGLKEPDVTYFDETDTSLSMDLDPQSLDLETYLLKITQIEAQESLNLIQNLLSEAVDTVILALEKRADMLLLTFVDGLRLAVSMDHIYGQIKGHLDAGTVMDAPEAAIRVFESQVNRDMSLLVPSVLFLRYRFILCDIKAMAQAMHFYPVDSISLHKSSLTGPLIPTPTHQKHIVYLSFTDHPGQYLVLAIAGSKDWDPTAVENTAEIRTWLLKTRISEAAKGLILESCLPLHPYHVLSGEAGSNNYLTDDTLMKATALAKKQFVYHSFVSQLIQSKIPFGYMTHPASRKVESLPSVPLIQNLESQPKLVVSPASLGLPRLIPLISDLYIYLEDDNDGSAETTEPSYTVSAKIRIRSKRVPLSSHVVVRNPHWTFYTENQSLSFRKEGFTDYVADILGFLRPTMKLARLAYQLKRKESAMKESLISIIDYQPSALDVSCRGSIFRVTCTSGSYQIVSKSQQKSHLALEKYLISAVKVLNQYENICSVFESISTFLQVSEQVERFTSGHETGKIRMLPQSLTHFRIYWLSTYAVDVHFLSRELVLIQDAFYSGVHVFPDGVTKVVNDGKIKNPQYIFKNKPVPSFQLLEVPSRLDPKKQPGHESQPSFVLPVSRGYLFSKNALELYMIRLLDLIEKTLVLDKMHRRLNLLKDASQVDYFHHDESSLRVIWTTEVVKAALSFKGDRSCQILIVPQKPDLMAQYQLTSTDGKPFSDCLTTRMNSLEYLEGKHQEFVESLINLSMTPLHVIRDMISIAKWEDSPATNGLGARWTLLVPEAPEFHHLSGAVPFKIDLKASTICMMISFFPQGTPAMEKESHVFIPVKYNFATGVLNPWRGQSDAKDMTVHDKGSRELSDYLRRASQPRYLSSLPLVERVLTQASMKDVPIQLGGPGKLFVIVKHLCSRTLSDLKAFVL